MIAIGWKLMICFRQDDLAFVCKKGCAAPPSRPSEASSAICARVSAASIPQWSWVSMGYLMNDLNLVYDSEGYRGQARSASNLRS